MSLIRFKCACFALAGAAFALLATAGCLLSSKPYKQVNLYDMGFAKNIAPEGTILNVESFINESSSRNKFMYRTGTFTLKNDDYNRWTKSPSMLVSQYMQSAFRTPDSPENPADDRYILNGKVICFEINLEKNHAIISVEYEIKSQLDRTKKFQNFAVFTEKFNKQTPDEFAKAIKAALEKLAPKIKKDLMAFAEIQKKDRLAQAAKNEQEKQAKASK